MSWRLLVVLGVAIALLAGCAGYSITRDGQGEGYDVYTPEPYIMVTIGDKTVKKDGQNQLETTVSAQVVWLPNYKKRYRIKTWSGLAKSDFQFTFDHGWMLRSTTAKVDSTEFPIKLATLIAEKIPTLAEVLRLKKMGVRLYPKKPKPVVLFYRLEFDEQTGFFKDLVLVGKPIAIPK